MARIALETLHGYLLPGGAKKCREAKEDGRQMVLGGHGCL